MCVVGLAEKKNTQPCLAGTWGELGKNHANIRLIPHAEPSAQTSTSVLIPTQHWYYYCYWTNTDTSLRFILILIHIWYFARSPLVPSESRYAIGPCTLFSCDSSSRSPPVPSFVRTQVVSWQLLAAFGNFWQVLATFGSFWQPLEAFGSLWQLLAAFGNFL